MIIGIANIIGCKNTSGGATPPSNTIPPSISGSSVIGSTLNCNDGTWIGTLPITFTYQWKRNGSDIIGETTSTYVLVNADYANSITCEVTATNSAGISSVLSDVIIGTATIPSATTDPVISGTNVVGQTLSCTTGTWTGTPVITYTYQWKRNGSDILGANTSTYVLAQADAANTISCVVTATNIVGSVNALSSNSFIILDADAQAFLTATGITDATITGAINTLVLDLKGFNLWTKMYAVYPFVGGTSTTHKYNLKTPADTDAAFRLVFNGGFTHTINGIAGNGTNGFADTKFNPVSQLSVQNNFSISIYSRTNLAAAQFDIGNSDFWAAGTKGTNIVTLYSNSNRYINIANNNYLTLNADTNSLGFYCGATNGSSTQILYKNGINVLSGTSTQSGFSNSNLYISAVNELNIAQQYSSKQYAFGSIGEGLSATEASNFYTAVQNFQTTLSRQV